MWPDLQKGLITETDRDQSSWRITQGALTKGPLWFKLNQLLHNLRLVRY